MITLSKRPLIKMYRKTDAPSGVYFFLAHAAIVAVFLFTLLVAGSSQRTLVTDRNGRQVSLDADTSMKIDQLSARLFKGIVYLSWNGNEKVSGYYLVQRCNGSDNCVNIGTIDTKGNKGGFIYSFMDKEPLSEEGIYKILFVGYNDNYAQSDFVRTVMISEFFKKDS